MRLAVRATAALLLLLASAILSDAFLFPRPERETPEYWAQSAKEELRRAQAEYRKRLPERAKSAILFVGDGLGVSTITPARILKGQLANSSGEEAQLEFDSFPHLGLAKTYSANRQTSDSPETATAFLTGVKINNGMVGVKDSVPRSTCTVYRPGQHDLESFLRMAVNQGMSVGVVTTTRITHATPAAAYANSVDRNWESDKDRATDTRGNNTAEQKMNCTDIATQLVEKAWNFTVVLGGGRRNFLPNTTETWDPSKQEYVNGSRWDGVDLVQQWKKKQQDAGRKHMYVENRTQLVNLDPSSVDSLFGLFTMSHMRYDYDNQHLPESQRDPSIAEMTEAAIKVLKKNSKGYVLLVEGGRIDHAHHDNQAQRALYDTVSFDKAVGAAKRMTSEDDTLLVVTADHGHVFSIGQYGLRGQPVTGLRYQEDGEPELAPDNMPFTVLNYADGPGAPVGTPRKNLTDMREDLENSTATYDYKYPAMIPYDYDSHGGEDVSIHAMGPGAFLFHSVHEQSYIAHAVMRTLCLGDYKDDDHCKPPPRTTPNPEPSGAGHVRGSGAVTLLVLAAGVLAAGRL